PIGIKGIAKVAMGWYLGCEDDLECNWIGEDNEQWPSRLCAQAQLGDDMPFHKQDCTKYTQLVFFESYNVVPPPPTRLFSPPKIDLSYSCLEEFQQPEFQSYGPKSKNESKEILNKLKESHDAPLVKNRMSDNKDCIVESPIMVEKKNFVPTISKIEFVKAKL
nr:hypothetical protein [Tanacetum cinerariifolium]